MRQCAGRLLVHLVIWLPLEDKQGELYDAHEKVIDTKAASWKTKKEPQYSSRNDIRDYRSHRWILARSRSNCGSNCNEPPPDHCHVDCCGFHCYCSWNPPNDSSTTLILPIEGKPFHLPSIVFLNRSKDALKVRLGVVGWA